MRGEKAIVNLEIKKKSGSSINPDIHHSKVLSSVPKRRKKITTVIRGFLSLV